MTTDTATAGHAFDARVATAAGQGLARLIEQEKAKGTAANRTIIRAAESAAAEWQRQGQQANAALIRGLAEGGGQGSLPTWGHRFAGTYARTRTGYTSAPVDLGGYLDLEERATARPLAPGAAPGGIGPIAARCGTIPAAPGQAALLRWDGPLQPAAPQTPEELKAPGG